jgi:hypothetical protein
MAKMVVGQRSGSVQRQDSAHHAVTELARVVVAVLQDRAFEAPPVSRAPEAGGLSFLLRGQTGIQPK